MSHTWARCHLIRPLMTASEARLRLLLSPPAPGSLGVTPLPGGEANLGQYLRYLDSLQFSWEIRPRFYGSMVPWFLAHSLPLLLPSVHPLLLSLIASFPQLNISYLKLCGNGANTQPAPFLNTFVYPPLPPSTPPHLFLF